MIDWALVGFSALWVLGLAIALSALSFAYYRADTEGRRIRQVLSAREYQTTIDGGLTLVCLGLVGSSRTAWERVVWSLLAIAFGLQGFQAWRAGRGK